MFLNVEQIESITGIITEDCSVQEQIILDIFNGAYVLNTDDDEIYNLLGLYHEYITEDYKKMDYYYLKAIEKDNSTAMCNLALHHKCITKNYEQTEKYLLIAIGKGNLKAMRLLASYHEYTTKDYEKMEYYYLMAIEKCDTEAMCRLAFYYKNTKKDYIQMEKYFLMAIEKGNIDAMYTLARHHQTKTKDYKKMEYYYLMAIENGDENAYDALKIIKSNSIELFEKINSLDIPDNIVELQRLSLNQDIKFYLKSKLKKESGIFIKLFEDEKNIFPKDFIIISLDQEHSLHKFMLNSKFFLNMFFGGFKEQTNIKMEYSSKVINCFIKWLYTGEISSPEELIELANEYFFDDLKELCLIKIRYGDLLN